MTNERLYEVAKRFINKEHSLMHITYDGADIEACDRDELIAAIKVEMKNELKVISNDESGIKILKGIYDILSKIKNLCDYATFILTRKNLSEEIKFTFKKMHKEIIEWANNDWVYLYTLYMLSEIGYINNATVGTYEYYITEKGLDFLDIFKDDILIVNIKEV